MKLSFNIDVTEQGKTSFDRDTKDMSTFPPKTVTIKGNVDMDLSSEEIAMVVAQSPSNLGCEGARQALATKLMELWTKVAAK